MTPDLRDCGLFVAGIIERIVRDGVIIFVVVFVVVILTAAPIHFHYFQWKTNAYSLPL
jgi:uncharacterized integral membrane protein